MTTWNEQVEKDLTILLKDWMKQHGRTQSDLRKSLQAQSTRMSSLLEVLKNEHKLGGLPKVAERLCKIEAEWTTNQTTTPSIESHKQADPFGQLDLLLQEIRDNREA